MAITYQFNKTSLQTLEKDLKMRQRSLPTLQSKETALRLEVKKGQGSRAPHQGLRPDDCTLGRI